MCRVIVFETCLGWMAAIGSVFGLQRIILPRHSKSAILEQISQNNWLLVDNRYSELSGLAEDIRHYLEGKDIVFHYRLDLIAATEFQKQVWHVVKNIPYGQTRSYSWVTKVLGLPGGARAVGQALARNPLPIIVPCHRVINSDGSLGGFSGGMELKRRLLQIEKSGCAQKSRNCFEKSPCSIDG